MKSHIALLLIAAIWFCAGAFFLWLLRRRDEVFRRDRTFVEPEVEIKVVCSWCKETLHDCADPGAKVSHTICPKCERDYRALHGIPEM